jgi:PAS domain S-box-containing protein
MRTFANSAECICCVIFKAKMMQQNLFENIPRSFLDKWQGIANLLARIIGVPAALIMKTENEFMEVFVSSETKNNPYNPKDKEHWHGLYCETVIKTQKTLRIPNALKDKNWDKNPDLKLGMLAYFGFPINFPDNTPFGTLCVLDNKERQFTVDHENLLLQFKNVVELDLAVIFTLDLQQDSSKKDVIQKLLQSNAEFQTINEEYLSANDEVTEVNERLLQAKKTAEESEQKFRLMYENTSVGIAVISLDFNIMDANRAYCDMLGYTREELLGKTLKDITDPSTLDNNLELQRQLKERIINSYQVEKKFIHKKGHLVYGLLNATLVKNEKNEALYFLGNVQNISKRKKAEEALRNSEKKIRSIYDVAPVGIGLVSDRVLKEVNRRVCEMTGYSKKELLNKDAGILYPSQEEYEYVGREKYKQIREKGTGSVETLWQKKDGTIINVLLASTPMDMNNISQNVSFTALDISERKRAETVKRIQYNITQAVIASKSINDLFDSIKYELKTVIDSRNIFIALYNDETAKLHSPIIKNEKDNIREWDAEKSLTGYLIRHGEPLLLRKDEIMNLHKNGHIEIIGTVAEAWLGVPLKTESDTFGAVVIQSYENPNAYNQTDLEILEVVAYELSTYIDRQRNREMAVKLSKAVEQSSVAVVITDDDGRIEYVNPFFTELTGYRLEDVLSRNPNILQSGQHSRAFYQELWDTILSGKDWEGEFRNRKKDGSLYWEKAIISPIINNDGRIKNFVAVKEDITERKRMLEELVKAKEKAEESDRLKTAFLNNMSHEIRTPLNAICGFTDILNSPEITEEKRERLVSIIQNSSNQLLSIVSDILTVSSLETKQEKVYIEKVCINTIIVDLLLIFKQQAGRQNISLYAKKDLSDKQSVIYTDKTKLTQILSNLLSNALKFTHEGFVEFGYELVSNMPDFETSDRALQFYVKDSGIGIKPKAQLHIFKRFMQADKTINMTYGGTGLGLSISRSFTELLGGTIWVESEPGKGSTFYFTLPYKPGDETGNEQSVLNEHNNSGLILVAEDEEYNYLLIEEYLSDLNLKLIHAKDGIETIKIWQANPNIVLILMDIKMPRMSGDEAAKRIKEISPNMPIIAQSGYALQHEIIQYKDLFDDYLAKPIKKADLKERVMKYVNIPKQ